MKKTSCTTICEICQVEKIVCYYRKLSFFSFFHFFLRNLVVFVVPSFFENLFNILFDTVRVKNKLYVFQNKNATKSKQNSNKIMILFDQNFDFVAFLF